MRGAATGDDVKSTTTTLLKPMTMRRNDDDDKAELREAVERQLQVTLGGPATTTP